MDHSESILHLTRQVCVLDAYSDLPVCDMSFAQQTTFHILVCPLMPFEDGVTVLHQVSSEAAVSLTNLDVDL
jgi:hypothetical protein